MFLRFPAPPRCIFAAILMISPVIASASIVTIGPSADCDYMTTGANNPIAQALADGHRDLRVVADTLNVGGAGTFLSDVQPDVSIRGGYADCAAADAEVPPLPEARSQWRASPGQSLLAVLSFRSERGTLSLSGFTLEPALTEEPMAPNGGALVVGGPIDAEIKNVAMSRFKAAGQGGALMLSTRANVTLRNTQVRESAAARGGGVACEDATLQLDASSLVIGNRAVIAPGAMDTGWGGGVYLDNCVMISDARVDTTGSPLSGGISYNHADRAGGGVVAKNSQVLLLGGESCTVTPAPLCRATFAGMTANVAGLSAGGIHADNSFVTLAFADVSANSAASRGGGIEAINDSTLFLDGSGNFGRRAFCERTGGCMRMRHNRAGFPGGSGKGGAIALDASSMEMQAVVFTDNHGSRGTAISLENQSRASIHQSVISQRGPAPEQPLHSMVLAGDNSTIAMLSSTLILDEVVAPEAAGMLTVGNGAKLDATSNVLFSRGAPLFSASPTATLNIWECNAVSDPDIAATWWQGVLIGPQDFERPAQPLRPARGGAMVDICEGEFSPDHIDIEGNLRVVQTIPGRESTPQDAGAFEQQGNHVFSDGFEEVVDVTLQELSLNFTRSK